MNSTKTLLVIGCVILAMTLLSDCVTSYAYDDDGGGGGDDVEPSNGVPFSSSSVGKRSWTSALCRRCMFHRDDWMSCSLCYGRPRASVPYYSKRASVAAADYEEADDDDGRTTSGVDSSPSSYFLLDRRCCDAVRGIRQCCRRGAGKRDYHAVRFPLDDFDGQGDYEDAVVGREYATSFFPLERGIGSGQCSCCDGPLLDYSCCSLSCSRRK